MAMLRLNPPPSRFAHTLGLIYSIERIADTKPDIGE